MSIASPLLRHSIYNSQCSSILLFSRPSFASSSRLAVYPRSVSHLAQPSAEPSGFEGIPAAAYSGSVEGKGKEKSLATAAPKPRAAIKSKRSAISMTPAALDRLRALVSSPTEPRLLRIGVKTRGCAGMAYHLDYVPPPGGRFDEVVEQDGVRVLIDSKALFSIIGSRMDWRDNRLSAGFVFDNPNVVDTCGCGESYILKVNIR
ncbi:MAG: Iron-sulfur assembly protein 1 [Tremellales sp. Tagirdzhanova-0007]|nr:MAG: Iron-sulfur assembly protein 1 [Tremellales sp. Tagirdzhanova-0007]